MGPRQYFPGRRFHNLWWLLALLWRDADTILQRHGRL